MKKIKSIIILTCTDEYFDRHYLKLKADVDSGEIRKKFLVDGVTDAEITFEELSL